MNTRKPLFMPSHVTVSPFSRRLAERGGLGRERPYGAAASVVTMDEAEEAEALSHRATYGAEIFHLLNEMTLGGDCA